MIEAQKFKPPGSDEPDQASQAVDHAAPLSVALPAAARPLKIAILSPYFFPDVGGTERAIEILAREFVALGHEARIVTSARYPRPDEAGRARGDIPASVEVVRRASVLDVIRAMQWADVGLINHATLKLALPAILTGKPCVIAHHMYIDQDRALMRLPNRLLRRYVVRKSKNVACSKAMGNTLRAETRVVHNGYRDDVWLPPAPDADRPIDILYAGRVNAPKGVKTLLEAVALLKQRGLRPRVVLIGPEGEGFSVEPLLAALKIGDLVEYHGPQWGAEVRATQSAAKVLAIPSEQELFGIVALEGIASGCAIAASKVGGLPEAVGPAGLLIAPGDAAAWADGLEYLLTHPEETARLRLAGAEHLRQFSARRMADGYLAVLHEAASDGAASPRSSAARAETAAPTVSQDTPKILS